MNWERTSKERRRPIVRRLERTPSLRPMLTNADWLSEIGSDAVAAASVETGLADFPESCPWPTDQVMHSDWLPA